MKRKAIGKKIRFEIFKRDSFTCQYCGEKAPDVILELDHIQPHSKGGDDSLLNLLTSCKGCNSGKSNRTLSDATVIDKKRSQLEGLQERKAQLDMMFEWQKALLNLDGETLKRLCQFWQELTPGFKLTDSGTAEISKLLKTFKMDEIMVGMKRAEEAYFKKLGTGALCQKSVDLGWSKIGGICRMKRLDAKDPDLGQLYYIRGIVRKRFENTVEWEAMNLLKKAYADGAPLDQLYHLAKTKHSYYSWEYAMSQLLK